MNKINWEAEVNNEALIRDRDTNVAINIRNDGMRLDTKKTGYMRW